MILEISLQVFYRISNENFYLTERFYLFMKKVQIHAGKLNQI